ncbi:MAG: class I SAM-dependent methyltransferase [Chloroflexi bacterium]|nr:class I SAM-dependent methyltransferase [Chloroflexota bacterium]
MTWRQRRGLGRVAAGVIARIYFDISYALLVGSVAGRRFLTLTAAGGVAAHGYLTTEDRDFLLTDLDPAPGDRLLDLGCGIGSLALEMHRRSGAQIVGVDVSRRAVAAATRRARRAGVSAAVRFYAGDLACPPLLGATSAYAIDSLMFAPDLAASVRGIGEALGPNGRLFAALLVTGPNAGDRLGRSLHAADVRVERFDDVTAALDESSRRRADAARTLLRERTATSRGRLAMLLILAEEALVQRSIEAGRMSRWRFLIAYQQPTPGGGLAYAAPCPGGVLQAL